MLKNKDTVPPNESTAEKDLPATGRVTDPGASIHEEMSYSGLNTTLIAACIVISIVCGMGSAWLYNRYFQKEIVVLDVKKIVADKNKQFVDTYKDKTPTAEVKIAMDQDIRNFTVRLDAALNTLSKDKIILPKDGVLSENVRDLTDDMEKELKGK